MPVGDLPRVSAGVALDGSSASAPLSAVAPDDRTEIAPRSGPGVSFLGSTMAGGTGCPWEHTEPHEKQADARAREQLTPSSGSGRVITKILIGVGVAAAVGAATLMATQGGSHEAKGPAQQAHVGAAGPRGGGAAFVWKVGFR